MGFLVHRALHSLVLLVGLSLLSFAFLQLAPGNFFDELRLNPRISHDTLVHLEKQYGLDKPFAERYFVWVRSAAKGDWGVSFAYSSPVAPLIWPRARNTLLVTGLAMLLSWMIALPVGILSAAQRGRWLDGFFSLGASLLLVTPDLLLALGLLWLALKTHWFPAGGMQSLSSSGTH